MLERIQSKILRLLGSSEITYDEALAIINRRAFNRERKYAMEKDVLANLNTPSLAQMEARDRLRRAQTDAKKLLDNPSPLYVQLILKIERGKTLVISAFRIDAETHEKLVEGEEVFDKGIR